jgi:RNA-directed DNA polymerase
MARHNSHIPFERYADDIVCHCRSADEAQALRGALQDRLATCKLEMHPGKTKIVYCKDKNRRGDYTNTSFDFLGFTFRARKALWKGVPAHSFLPAVSQRALKSISRTVKRWRLHLRSDMPLDELAKIANPTVRGWINDFSNFYRTALRPALQRIDLYVIRWTRRKFKRLRRKTKGSREWFDRLRRADPNLFAHWQLCHGNGRTSGAV